MIFAVVGQVDRPTELLSVARVFSETNDPEPSNDAMSVQTLVRARPGLRVEDVVKEEEEGWVRVPISVHPTPEAGFVVHYETGDGSAVAGVDYRGHQGIVRFEPGQGVGYTEAIEIYDDVLGEPDEFFEIHILAAGLVPIIKSPGTVVIKDQDAPCLSIDEVIRVNVGVRESLAGVDVPIGVRLTRASTLPVTVDYFTEDGTATSGTDYEETRGRLVFAPGQTEQTLQVRIVGNTLDESGEHFFVHLLNPVHAQLGCEMDANTGETCEVTISDEAVGRLSWEDASVVEGDEGPHFLSFHLTLESVLLNPVSFHYRTVAGSAREGKDFASAQGRIEISPGVRSVDIEVVVYGDHVFEGDEMLTLELSQPVSVELQGERATGWLLDDDPVPVLRLPSQRIEEGDEGLKRMWFEATLTGLSEEPVLIHYQTRDGSASAHEDYQPVEGVMRFASESSLPERQIEVGILGDRDDEPDETFDLVLTQQGETRVVLPARFPSGTLVDDDEPPLIELPEKVEVLEGDDGWQRVVIPIAISSQAGPGIRLRYEAFDGTAMSGSDYLPLTGEIELNDEEALDLLMVVGDVEVEGDEKFVLRYTVLGEGRLVRGETLVVILNDDGSSKSPPVVRFISPEPWQFFPTGDIGQALPWVDLPVQVEAFDPDGGEIIKVELYLGPELYGIMSREPFETVVESLSPGEYQLRAIAVDDEGMRSQPDRVFVHVGDPVAQVAIVENVPGEETEVMRRYLLDMKMSSWVLDQQGLEVDDLRPFDAVIWTDADQQGLQEGTVDALSSSHHLGMPMYFIGNRLMSSADHFDSDRKDAWYGLLRAQPEGEVFVCEEDVRFQGEDSTFGPANNLYGRVDVFAYENPMEGAVFDGNMSSLGFCDERQVFGIYPSREAPDTGQTRMGLQLFGLLEGGEEVAVEERKALFQNTVCWLLDLCPTCSAGGLRVAAEEEWVDLSVPIRMKTGEPFPLAVRLINNGECDVFGSKIEIQASVGLAMEGFTLSQVIDWEKGEGWFVWEPGVIGRGTEQRALIEVTLKADFPGTYTLEIFSMANFGIQSEQTLRFEVEGDPGSAVDSPWLLIERGEVSGLFNVYIRSQGEGRYVLEEAEQTSGPWRTMSQVGEFIFTGKNGVQVAKIQTEGETKFFRVTSMR